jgi:hypothetical protein
MKKMRLPNKYAVIGALIFGATGVIVGTITDRNAPCDDAAESFLASSSQVRSEVGTIHSLQVRRRVSMAASTSGPAYISYDYVAKGDLAKALIGLKADPTRCSFAIESIDTF